MEEVTTDKILDDYLIKLFKELDTTDRFSLILKGQLHVEAFLNVLLNTIAKNSSDFELDKIMFNRKVKLCSALGLIHEDTKSTFTKLASMRNNLAHELWHEVTEQEITDFENTFKSCKSLQSNSHLKLNINNKLGEIIGQLWIYLFEQSLRLPKSKNGIIAFWENQIDYKFSGENSVTLDFFSKLPKS
jgi:uncharacterized protein YutE (UPF0331/DUF86 family)